MSTITQARNYMSGLNQDMFYVVENERSYTVLQDVQTEQVFLLERVYVPYFGYDFYTTECTTEI